MNDNQVVEQISWEDVEVLLGGKLLLLAEQDER